jgi:hypothetical protein
LADYTPPGEPPIIGIAKLTVRMLELLYATIHDHRRRFLGDHPQRVELHLALRPLLIEEILAKDRALRRRRPYVTGQPGVCGNLCLGVIQWTS